MQRPILDKRVCTQDIRSTCARRRTSAEEYRMKTPSVLLGLTISRNQGELLATCLTSALPGPRNAPSRSPGKTSRRLRTRTRSRRTLSSPICLTLTTLVSEPFYWSFVILSIFKLITNINNFEEEEEMDNDREDYDGPVTKESKLLADPKPVASLSL